MLISCSKNDIESKDLRDSQDTLIIYPVVVFGFADSLEFLQSIESNGIVEPDKQITIQSRINGFINNWSIHDGKYVERGQELFSIIDVEYDLEVKDAQDKYIKAVTDYKLEKRIRSGKLLENNVDDNDIEALLKNQTGLTQAEIALQRAYNNLSYTKIYAPFSGFVHTKNNFQTGQYIVSGNELGTLVDYASGRVKLEVLESEIYKINDKKKVLIFHTNKNYVEGTVKSVSPVIDPKTNTGQVVATFHNKELLFMPGMMVQARIIINTISGRTRVPRSAILERGGRKVIFKLNKDVVEWNYIEPLAMNSEWAVLHGNSILPGDTIAIDQHFAISHLQRVDVKIK